MIPTQRFYGNAQAHVLAPLGVLPVENSNAPTLGPGWGCFGVKHSKEYLADYVSRVNEAGGVVTFDIGVYRDGSFDPDQIAVLEYVGQKTRSTIEN